MTTSKIDNSQRTAAKVAGWSGLLTFAIVVFGNYVLLNPLVVPGDAAATAVAIGGGGIGMAQRKAVAVAIPVFSTIAPTLSTAVHAVLPTPRFTSFVARRIPNFLAVTAKHFRKFAEWNIAQKIADIAALLAVLGELAIANLIHGGVIADDCDIGNTKTVRRLHVEGRHAE